MPEFSQDEIIVLRKINALGKTTADSLARELGEPYTTHDLSAYMKLLEQRTLLNKMQDNPPTYGLTPFGLIAIGTLPDSAKKVYSSVPSEKCFHFYTGEGPDKFTKLSACSLSDLREKARRVDVKSLEFHVQRGDIAKWCRDVLGNAELAKEFDRLRPSNLNGETLRNRVVELVDGHIGRLTSSTTRH